mmetsp:Transcript_8572/g.12818  ORF Transcript_8572/g.12818 Transcript_8572/m.12818 type:complete len:286 (-) Transcript_8572:555-1412(-)
MSINMYMGRMMSMSMNMCRMMCMFTLRQLCSKFSRLGNVFGIRKQSTIGSGSSRSRGDDVTRENGRWIRIDTHAKMFMRMLIQRLIQRRGDTYLSNGNLDTRHTDAYWNRNRDTHTQLLMAVHMMFLNLYMLLLLLLLHVLHLLFQCGRIHLMHYFVLGSSGGSFCLRLCLCLNFCFSLSLCLCFCLYFSLCFCLSLSLGFCFSLCLSMLHPFLLLLLPVALAAFFILTITVGFGVSLVLVLILILVVIHLYMFVMFVHMFMFMLNRILYFVFIALGQFVTGGIV